MSKVGLTVEGAPELSRGLSRVADELGDLSTPGKDVADRVADRARSGAPVDTGALAASIRTVVYPDAATVEAGEPYAPFVHWGVPSRNIEAQPFLTLALEAEASPAIDAYAEYVQDLLDRVEGI